MKLSSVLLAGLVCLATTAPCLAQERIVALRFHGNHSIPDAEMQDMAGLRVGDTLATVDADEVRERMMKTGRFEWVDVLKRYRSLRATDSVVLIISVKETEPTSKKFMFFPILSYADEYGFTFGARVTAIDLFKIDDRISFPLTWGGVRQAAAEPQIPLPIQVFDVVDGHAGISQRENPFFETADRRGEFRGTLRKRIGIFSYDAGAGWTDVKFGETRDQFSSFKVGGAIDTRTNRIIPRNAVYAGVGYERMNVLDGGPSFNRFKLDLRGFKSLWGQTILAAQVLFHGTDGALPDYQKPFLGGGATLRGYSAGEFVGDNLMIGSLELRMPLTSPASIARAGLTAFFDTGTVYDDGTKLSRARFRHGVGGGFFVFAFGLGFKLEAGYDLDNSVKVHFGTQFRF